MRFPSLHHIWQETVKVILRYPVEIVVTFIGAAAAIQLTYRNTEAVENLLQRVLMTATIALPAFLAVTLWGRYRQLGMARKTVMYLVVLALLLLFFFTTNEEVMERDVTRFFLLDITAHLMVASAGFIDFGSTHAFWQFNRHLFLRIITAAIFSIVLFAGLSGAIAAMDALFNMKVQGELYGRTGIWIMGVFNTVFFLAGIPASLAELEEEHEYPKVLKVFTQFVLVPLVFIYLLILLAYEVKIVAQWELPNGWVSNLIIGYGIAGILSILLVYPIRNHEGNRWIKFFARWFYLLLLPLVALMFVAIGVRIGNYGLTEQRIFVLVLAVWLAGISLYFLLRPEGNIRVIPVSLALIAFILCGGPLSVFEIAKNNQRKRLELMLQENGLLKDGKVVKASENSQIFFHERRNISTTVEYLLEHHGVTSLEPWFVTDSISDERYQEWKNTRRMMAQLNVEYVDPWTTDSVSDHRIHYHDYAAKKRSLKISGYDEYIFLPEYHFQGADGADTMGLYVRYSGKSTFALYHGSERLTDEIDARELMKQIKDKHGVSDLHDVPAEEMRMHITGKGCDVLVVFDYLRGHTDATSISYSGAVFIKWE